MTSAVGQENLDEEIVDLPALMDKYPFTKQQLEVLLELRTLQIQGEKKFSLFSVTKKPEIKWVEENILLEPFSIWINTDGDFFECMANLTGRKGSPLSELLTIYNSTGNSSEEKGNAAKLIGTMYRLGLACHCIQFWDDDDLDLETVQKCAEMENTSMIKSLQTFGQDSAMENIKSDEFINWANINFPQMECILSSFFHLGLFSSLEHNSGKDSEPCRLSLYALGNRTMFRFPLLEKMVLGRKQRPDFHSLSQQKIFASISAESTLFNNPDVMGEGGVIGHFAFGLALMDPKLCGKWHRLYSTGMDGFAFLNLQRALTGYAGPTIMLIRPTEVSINKGGDLPTPGVFGFYTANPWKESKQYHGTSDCFLFRAESTWNIYHPRSYLDGWNFKGGPIADQSHFPASRIKENYMRFRPSTGRVNVGRSNEVHGLSVGGTENDPRFQITESLECCTASSGVTDATFESGQLLPGAWDKYFNVDNLEIWGVGGENIVRKAITKKEEYTSVADATRRRVQRVDKKQFLEDFQSGMMGSGNLFKHRYDGNVRHDFGTDPNDQERPCID